MPLLGGERCAREHSRRRNVETIEDTQQLDDNVARSAGLKPAPATGPCRQGRTAVEGSSFLAGKEFRVGACPQLLPGKALSTPQRLYNASGKALEPCGSARLLAGKELWPLRAHFCLPARNLGR